MTFRCQVCGQDHDELPDLGAEYPDHWYRIPDAERAARVRWTTDTCVMDDEAFYIRGVIRIPVHGESEPFGWGVWVSQKRENFETYVANFDSAAIGPFFGWLSTNLAYYGPDGGWHLKTMAHFRGNGLRPHIVVEPTDHPLAVHQREGVSLETAWDFVHFSSLSKEEQEKRALARRPTKEKTSKRKERN